MTLEVRPGEFARAIGAVLSACGKPRTSLALVAGSSSARGRPPVCILPDGSGVANPQA